MDYERMGLVTVAKTVIKVSGLPISQTKELSGFRTAEKNTETVAPLDSRTAFVLAGLATQQTIDLDIIWQPEMPSHIELADAFKDNAARKFEALFPQSVIIDEPTTTAGVDVKVAINFSGDGEYGTATFTPSGQTGFNLFDSRVQIGHSFQVGSDYYIITEISQEGVYQVIKPTSSSTSVDATKFKIVQRAQKFTWAATILKFEVSVEEDAYLLGRLSLGVTSEIIHTVV